MKTLKRIPGARRLARRLGLSPEDVDPRAFLLRRFPGGSIGAEIGVHKGEFSEQILRIVKPRKLHLPFIESAHVRGRRSKINEASAYARVYSDLLAKR
jgi:hypothetical protein